MGHHRPDERCRGPLRDEQLTGPGSHHRRRTGTPGLVPTARRGYPATVRLVEPVVLAFIVPAGVPGAHSDQYPRLTRLSGR